MQRSTDLCRNKHQFYRTAVYSRTHWRFATDETCVYSRLKSAIIKQAPSKTARHQAINDVIARAIIAAGVPVTKERVGLIPDSTASGLTDSH